MCLLEGIQFFLLSWLPDSEGGNPTLIRAPQMDSDDSAQFLQVPILLQSSVSKNISERWSWTLNYARPCLINHEESIKNERRSTNMSDAIVRRSVMIFFCKPDSSPPFCSHLLHPSSSILHPLAYCLRHHTHLESEYHRCNTPRTNS